MNLSNTQFIHLTGGPSTTDWMTAIGTIIATLGGFAGFVALSLEILRRRKLRLRPPSGLMEYLVRFNETLVEIINNGGQESIWFLQDERRRNEGLLTAISGQIVDEELNSLVLQVLSGYNECFARSPGHNMLHRSENTGRVVQQTDAAHLAQEKCQQAIIRVGELFRLYQE